MGVFEKLVACAGRNHMYHLVLVLCVASLVLLRGNYTIPHHVGSCSFQLGCELSIALT